MLYVYVKIRLVNVADSRDDYADMRPQVWGLLLGVPEGFEQVEPHKWIGTADGMRFEIHGPVPVPGP